MAPVWTSGLQSTMPPVNAEVEAMCASLLEDTQAARASAAAVRQRALAGTEEGGSLDQHLPHVPLYATEEAADGRLTGAQTMPPPALELLSDDSDSDDADGGLEDEAIRAMEVGTVLGLCGNGRRVSRAENHRQVFPRGRQLGCQPDPSNVRHQVVY